MLKLIVFDWDGTLANSVEQIIKCKRTLAEKYNLPSPDEKISRSVLGMSFEKALAICFPTASAEVLANLGKEFHNLMQEDEYQAILFTDAVQILESLKQRGIKLAIATSKNRSELDKALAYHGLTEIFDLTCCGKEYQEKPHPAMLQYILAQLNILSSECLMIGDTTFDIEFANNAGIKIACVTFGAHSREKLLTLMPFAMIDSWIQLDGVLDRLCKLPQM